MSRVVRLDYDPTNPTAKVPGSSPKWRNVPTAVDGYVFDSKEEAEVYKLLRTRLRAGEIGELRVHPPFRLVVNDCLIATYIADFAYEELPSKAAVIVDVKSPVSRTRVYTMKRRLMYALYGVRIVEIDA
jgi:hypothetical protein